MSSHSNMQIKPNKKYTLYCESEELGAILVLFFVGFQEAGSTKKRRYCSVILSAGLRRAAAAAATNIGFPPLQIPGLSPMP